MASGWANDGAVQDQIDSTVRRDLPRGESLEFCEMCDEPIPEARRKAIPGVRLCVNCQQKEDEHRQRYSLYNRRGSKDSQLR
ncbi:Hypothetical Zinc-finger containing protein [Cronobacter sakazakii 696]|nr:Hypothetical Zinc-finger containing protein [Cronobacter sakazakii 696]